MVSANNAINDTIGASISGVTNTLTVTNPSNTASSAARETITVGGSSSGDCTLNWNVSGVTNWEMGIDNSDSDKLKISQGTSLGTNDSWIMTTAGERTMPLQPAFFAYLGTGINNVTGDGSSYFYGDTDLGVALTEIFDQNSDFTPGAGALDANGPGGYFTAPVDGKYNFTVGVKYGGITAAMNGLLWGISALTFTPSAISTNSGVLKDVSNTLKMTGKFEVLDLDAGDIVKFILRVDNGTKVADITSGMFETFCCGYLVV